MELILEELTNLGIFLFEFVLVYIPCFIGTICGIHFNQMKNQKGKTRRKSKFLQNFTLALSSSILPALVVLICELLIPESANIDFIFKYGISMLLGFIGSDKVTIYLSNLTNVFKIMKAVSEGKTGVIKLSDEIINEDDTDISDE